MPNEIIILRRYRESERVFLKCTFSDCSCCLDGSCTTRQQHSCSKYRSLIEKRYEDENWFAEKEIFRGYVREWRRCIDFYDKLIEHGIDFNSKIAVAEFPDESIVAKVLS